MRTLCVGLPSFADLHLIRMCHEIDTVVATTTHSSATVIPILYNNTDKITRNLRLVVWIRRLQKFRRGGGSRANFPISIPNRLIDFGGREGHEGAFRP